ncbi:hypothetical protein [Mucilaginibacter gotjawali]|uniref:Uncharacterized protein n=2 Tax=Mucilaginibacter gotjawali TaxID=1550579 RepID=A0A0X8X3W2_9SPHI|nr:hypothetical protein [Mucilaginibacter gotjawali]MBB3057564.1 hypothetical protein [Mucilaginibacter gotjawali]BAU55222.1 hypothetical protein MgSA37_03403 [Mucilaginibacter gotjawali]
MKIIITKTLIFIAVTTFAFTVKAQSDYVITVGGDSISCKIIAPAFGPIKYQSAAMDAPKRIKSDEIKEYYLSGDRQLYRAVFINYDKRATYLNVIENGKISLYEVINTTYSSMTMASITTKVWYIGKGTNYVKDFKSNGLFNSRSRNERKDGFAEMLEDNKNIYDKYRTEDKFSFEQIRNLIHLYNTGKPLGQYAQDYFIKKTKDTIFCEIELSKHYNNSRYRLNKKDRFTNMDTSVTEYFIGDNNVTVVKKIIPGEKASVYVRQIKKGRINLYEQMPIGNHEAATSYMYANKGDGPLILINATRSVQADAGETNKEQKAFLELFADNLTLRKELIETMKHDYNIDTITDYISRYNLAYLNNTSSNR